MLHPCQNTETAMHPHILYLALAVTYGNAAVKSFREHRWNDAIHQTIAAAVYACLAGLSLLPAAFLTPDAWNGSL
jgi:hypothetical protein